MFTDDASDLNLVGSKQHDFNRITDSSLQGTPVADIYFAGERVLSYVS